MTVSSEYNVISDGNTITIRGDIMYDAKKKDKSKSDELKFSSIYDRSYFNKSRNETVMSSRTSIVPSETLFFQ